MDKKNFSYDGRDYTLCLAKRPYLQYYIQYRNSNILERKRVYAGFAHCETLPEMKRAAIRLLQQPNKIEHKDFIDKYLELSSARLDKKTITTYKGMTNKLRQWCALHNKKIDKLKDKDAYNFLDYLYATKLHANTVAHYINVISGIYTDMCNRGFIDYNPFKGLKTPKVRPEPLNYFTREQSNMIRNYLLKHDPAIWIAVCIQHSCLLRPKELRHLQVYDIDLEDGLIHVRSLVIKTNIVRRAVIPPYLILMLKLYLAKVNSSQYVFTIHGCPGDNIVGRDYLSKRHKKCLNALKIIGNYGFYSWKHTGAIRAVQNGVDIRDLQRQGGWQDLSTVQRYLAIFGAMDNEGLKNKLPRI